MKRRLWHEIDGKRMEGKCTLILISRILIKYNLNIFFGDVNERDSKKSERNGGYGKKRERERII